MQMLNKVTHVNGHPTISSTLAKIVSKGEWKEEDGKQMFLLSVAIDCKLAWHFPQRVCQERLIQWISPKPRVEAPVSQPKWSTSWTRQGEKKKPKQQMGKKTSALHKHISFATGKEWKY